MKYLFFTFIIGIQIAFSQNNVGIGISTPDPSSILDVSSTNKGVLIPRMTTNQRNAITNPSNGLIVYNTDSNCMDYYKANTWYSVCNAINNLSNRMDTTNNRITTLNNATNIRIDTTNNRITTINTTLNSRIDSTINNFTTIVNNAMPCGSIIMWGGNISQIPTGWYLCDGTNNTPDLRDKFVRGSSGTTDHLTSGGNDQITLTTNQLPAHNHTGTTDISGNHNHSVDPPNTSTTTNGNHNHNMFDYYYSESFNQNLGWLGSGDTDSDNAPFGVNHLTDNAGDHAHSIDIPAFNSNTTGDHNHTFTTNNTGGGQAITILPSYYKLAYIKKCN